MKDNRIMFLVILAIAISFILLKPDFMPQQQAVAFDDQCKFITNAVTIENYRDSSLPYWAALDTNADGIKEPYVGLGSFTFDGGTWQSKYKLNINEPILGNEVRGSSEYSCKDADGCSMIYIYVKHTGTSNSYIYVYRMEPLASSQFALSELPEYTTQCYQTECEDECSTSGEKYCLNEYIMTCGQFDDDICLDKIIQTDCGATAKTCGVVLVNNIGTPSCVDAPLANKCTPEGETKCISGITNICSYTAQGNLDWKTTTLTCGGGDIETQCSSNSDCSESQTCTNNKCVDNKTDMTIYIIIGAAFLLLLILIIGKK